MFHILKDEEEIVAVLANVTSEDVQTGKVVHTFHDTAITNLRELVAMVPKLNVIGDPTLTALTQEIETLLCQHEPQNLRDNFILRKKAVEDAGTLVRKLASIEDVLCTQAEAA